MAASSAASARPAKAARNLRGMGVMLVSSVCSTGLNASIRYVGAELHPFEVAFFRNLFALVALIPLVRRGGLASLRTRRLELHVLRAVFNAVAMLALFTALTLEPLAKVAALNFTTPLFATLGAVVFLGERLDGARWASLGIGFAGALVIVRPGLEVFTLGAALMLFSATCWGIALVIIKVLTRTDSSVTVTIYANALMAPALFAVALFVWQWPSWQQLAWLGLVGLLGAATHITLTEAFRGADATFVLPVGFTKLAWAAVMGFAFFHEIPDPATVVGGLIICGGVFAVAYRERRLGAPAAGVGGRQS